VINTKSGNNEKKKTGTLEWADKNLNIQNGCKNNCVYCYAKGMALRFNRIKEDKEWETETFNEKSFNQKPRLIKGRIMFPSSHDIHLDNIDKVIEFLKKWIVVGNEFLIVSKPNPECIMKLVKAFSEYKDQITFRFTIGSANNEILKFWDNNAPTFEERLDSLRIAYSYGFRTSVSCEPILDNEIGKVVMAVEPYVTDTIWLGKMNGIKQRVKIEESNIIGQKCLKIVQSVNQDDNIRELYETFNNDNKIRWKDSIQKVIGIEYDNIG